MDLAEPQESEEASEEVVRAEHPEAAISAILFAMGDSVEIKKLADAIGYSEDETREIIGRMKARFERNKDFGLTIVELDNAVQMCSKTEMYEYLIKVAKIPKNMHLSDTALETLSIIAYKQPVTRAEVEKIRGVSCDHPINKLLEFGLITELGRLNAPGRPLLFGTTEEFLRSFGVKSIEDLPDIAPDRLEEFKREAAEEIQLKLDI
ncbi:MAG: SMC-Scp complex subunit ScpB [Lachnospiraceae bacterium]|nr:SMC-Scp complex subunit ScpB [Lachnospiraceae bacterium]